MIIKIQEGIRIKSKDIHFLVFFFIQQQIKDLTGDRIPKFFYGNY